MDIKIKDQLFVITGSSSGFGMAIAQAIIQEGGKVIMNARRGDLLQEFEAKHKGSVEIVIGDITTDAVIADILRKVGDRTLHGLVVNAGGPPAKNFVSTEMQDWDDAYENILRWKVKLTHEVLDKLLLQGYGRILYIESASVKQPIENLVLSTALRLSVVGFVKTLSQEVAKNGITCNVLAPGYHQTAAMQRLLVKKGETLGINEEEASHIFEEETAVGKLGDPQDLAALATWLLSPLANFITGQTISIDGGLVKGIMG